MNELIPKFRDSVGSFCIKAKTNINKCLYIIPYNLKANVPHPECSGEAYLLGNTRIARRQKNCSECFGAESQVSRFGKCGYLIIMTNYRTKLENGCCWDNSPKTRSSILAEPGAQRRHRINYS